MLEVLYEECPDQAVKVMTKALHVWAEDATEHLIQESTEMHQKLSREFADKHFPLYVNMDDDPLWNKYDRYGAKELLKTEFYKNFFERLGI